MNLHAKAALTLGHTCTNGTLATHSTPLPGYPFATAVPYALDATHNPVLCISALAEHTKNLLADPRVSLSVVQPGEIEESFLRESQVALGPRVSLLGADCFGIDFGVKGERHRQRFPDAPLTTERFATAAPRFAAELC